MQDFLLEFSDNERDQLRGIALWLEGIAKARCSPHEHVAKSAVNKVMYVTYKNYRHWKAKFGPRLRFYLYRCLCNAIIEGFAEQNSNNMYLVGDIKLSNILVEDETDIDRDIDNRNLLNSIFFHVNNEFSDRSRKIFWARFKEQLSIKEIANKIGTTQETVKTELSRIRVKLKKRFNR